MLSRAPGGSSSVTWSAAHGSSPAPKRPSSARLRSAAGLDGEPLRPRNSPRSPVAERSEWLVAAKATRDANSRL